MSPSNENKSSENLKVVFLGGLGEIGRNCAALELDGEILVVDCGLMFPTLETPGIDLILPDFEYLQENAEKVLGVAVTHGHEDHIGALPYLLREMPLKIWGSQLALSLARSRIEEAGLLGRAELVPVEDGDVVKMGGFSVEFIPVTHSVPDAHALAIQSRVGTVVHTGDFKLDLSPVDGRLPDLGRLAQIARTEGIRLLMADSTNAEEEGHSQSESGVGEVLDQIMPRYRGKRVVVTCFASHIHRIQQIADAAIDCGRKIFPLGRSMGRNIALARSLGLLEIAEHHLADIETVSQYPDDKVCVISTGSQGEPLSALSLMAANENRFLKLSKRDVVIISADIIPGNESAVGKVINGLHRRGAEVIHAGIAKVHTSGHAKRDELRLMHSVCQPESFIPVHGELRHLSSHAALAVEMGMDEDQVIVALDGDVIEVGDGILAKRGRVSANYLYVDGAVDGISKGVLRDRRTLASDGVVIVVVALEAGSGAVITGPEIITRGWAHHADDEHDVVEELLGDLGDAVLRAIGVAAAEGASDSETVARHIRKATAKLIEKRTKMRPMVVPVVTEI